MRSRSALALVLLVLVPIPAANASRRVTDVHGHEVTIRQGLAPRRLRVATNALRPVTNATVTVTAGADTDATHNDYRRIQDAIDAAGAGDVIELNGTFDFTAPFAAAAWALGDDNTAGTDDDYSVYIPANVDNVTVTATGLGNATLQGPGDLPNFDLEGVFYFDGGKNQNWVISNLRFLDFDNPIGMYGNTPDAFNGTHIVNNYFRLPVDLNVTVAPADVLQNIAIHFSYGQNQQITGNRIDLPGNGVSDGANYSTVSGMQSNASSGTTYDGLLIDNNELHILDAQSANPEVVYGIWENGWANSSNITVSNNRIINDAAGNDPALNGQLAYRVTSHSSASTTVTYSNNQVGGASIGFQWYPVGSFAGNQAVILTGNQISNCATGVVVHGGGTAHLETNSITGSGAGGGVHVENGTLTGAGASANSLEHNFISGGSGDGIWIEAAAGAIAPISQNDLGNNAGFGLRNETASSITAELNWWGGNLASQVAGEVSGPADADPWLASGTDVNAAAGFQPFLYATTSGTLTTFSGTASADTGALLAGATLTMQMDGQTATTLAAEAVNFAITLGDGDDQFTLGQTGIPTTVDGGIGNDRLIGTNVAQTWNVTGANAGNIPGAATSFIGVENLVGGSNADSFVFGAAGSLSGNVDGASGSDTLDNRAIPGATVQTTGPGSIDGFTGTAAGIAGTFDNINIIAGGSTADLSITKSGPATITPGGQATYNIAVHNAGPDAATGVVVTDVLPAGETFVSATPSQGTCSGTTTITCSLGTLANGSNATIALTVHVTASAGTIANTATVTGNETDPTPANASATASATVTNGVNVPTLSESMLLALMALLALVALKRT